MDFFGIDYVQKDIVVIVLLTTHEKLTTTRQNIYFVPLHYSIDEQSSLFPGDLTRKSKIFNLIFPNAHHRRYGFVISKFGLTESAKFSAYNFLRITVKH